MNHNHIRYQAVDGSFQWLSLERLEELFQVQRVAGGDGGHRRLYATVRRGVAMLFSAVLWFYVCAMIEGPMLGEKYCMGDDRLAL